MKGRRIPVEYNSSGKVKFPSLVYPGDYCGPMMGFTGKCPAVFFLKPNARDANAPPRARIIQHVSAPPHTFIEEPNGTLTIKNSISDTAGQDPESDGWHGFLTAGEWHL